ncbi:hypothetical protein P3G55_01250 [Leptospira sp. 96542]|nr:hypothetical protein [Leptospira sp. 96542]
MRRLPAIPFGSFLFLLTFTLLGADPSGSLSPLYVLQNEVIRSQSKSESSQFKKWIHSKKEFFIDDGKCQLLPDSKFQTVVYYRFTCGNSNQNLVLSFSAKRKNSIAKDKFRILGIHKIGKKKYLEIQTGSEDNTNLSEQVSGSDTEFDLPGKQGKIETSNQTIYKPLENPNLYYFKTITTSPKERKEFTSNLEVFFDFSCPLEFLEKDESFYWDQTIFYVFRITCIRDSVYSLLRVPGSGKEGHLVVSNSIANLPKRGDKFYGKTTLRKMTEKQIYWENFTLYYE